MSGWVVPASLLTAEEVAGILRAPSPKTVARLRLRGELRGVRIGRAYRYDVRDVEALIEQLRNENKEQA
ncbi:HTH DNA binding protein [Arthrobacter phage Abidatro]|uniref:Helix-turn-helix DNA-binding domain protein n=1 Tax=Arthrobacter phage Abidatro TaxID=2015853 RepID=A0A222ZER0_9CAUD|nr:HTH DNA binding protein [Arthrobacter phage Abidatro]ASR83207.1 helix-turn-helix DNA-binding domain protein [Arthrobacter phage Abidatro]